MSAATVRERELQQTVMDALKLFRWRAYHTFSSIHSSAGFPDVIACRRDRAIAVELKTEAGKVTPEQLAWLASLELAGLETFTWRPSDWLSGAIEAALR